MAAAIVDIAIVLAMIFFGSFHCQIIYYYYENSTIAHDAYG